MTSPKTILLTAGSGNIGRVLTPLLLSQNPAPKLVLPTTSIDNFKANDLAIAKSADPNIALVEGSIRDPIWFEELLIEHNVDAVFLCVTGIDEMFTALNCLDAISKAGTVKKVVYLSILGDFTSDSGSKNVYRDRSYPHIFSKVVVEQKLIHGNYLFEWTVLGPPFFFSNDLRLKMPLTQMSVYPEPNLEKGGSKIAIDDIALAARNVFLDISGKWSSKKIMLGSKRSYTTSETAELWSKALGKPIQTQTASKQTLDQFEENLRKMMGPDLDGLAWARDLRLLYEYSIVHGIHISDEDYKVQVQVLGKEPDDYGAWVKKTAALWL